MFCECSCNATLVQVVFNRLCAVSLLYVAEITSLNGLHGTHCLVIIFAGSSSLSSNAAAAAAESGSAHLNAFRRRLSFLVFFPASALRLDCQIIQKVARLRVHSFFSTHCLSPIPPKCISFCCDLVSTHVSITCHSCLQVRGGVRWAWLAVGRGKRMVPPPADTPPTPV